MSLVTNVLKDCALLRFVPTSGKTHYRLYQYISDKVIRQSCPIGAGWDVVFVWEISWELKGKEAT